MPPDALNNTSAMGDFLAAGLSRQPDPAELRFRQMIDSVKDHAIYMLDPQGCMSSWNRGAERLKGYSESEVIGRHMSMFYPQEAVAKGLPQKELQEALERGQHEHEGWRFKKDGSRFWANVVVTPMYDELGALIGFSKVVRDITEKKKTEEALQATQLRFRQMIDSVKDHAIYMLDPQGCMSSWNRGAERLKGYSESEVIGRHMSMFYPQEAVAKGLPQKELQEALERGQHEHEGWRFKKDGSRFWANVVVTPMYDELGALIGFSKVVRDITEKKKTEEALQETRAQLVQSEKLASLGSLVAGIAHEINTPVGISLTAASLLQDEMRAMQKKFAEGQLKRPDFEEFISAGGEAANIILANASRAAGLIQSFKMIAVDQSSNDERDILLGSYISEVLHSLRPHLRGCAVQVEVSCPQDPLIRTAPGAISQVLTNLVTNAITHAFDPGQSGRSLIATQVEDDEIAICFSDDGKGMQPDVLARIFEPFFTTRRGSGGSGLGMHIVYNLVEQTLGGRIFVESSPGTGSRFVIRFPHRSVKTSDTAHELSR